MITDGRTADGSLPDVREAGNPAGGGRAADRRIWLRSWLGTLMPAGMLIYVVVAATGVPGHTRGAGAVAGYTIAVLFGCCYTASAIAIRLDLPALVWAALAAMTALFIAEVPFAGDQAYFLVAVIVPFAIGRIGRRAGPLVAAGVLVCVVLPWARHSWHGQPGWIQALDVFFTSLVTLGLVEIITTNQALVEARAEVARLASEAERNRIARDLHDLLGHSLTAITVKSGLAHRLAALDAERAAQEIAEVETLSRQALAEVRAAVAGYRDVTLVGELARGRELLRASGVTADLPTATDMVDAAHQELFGWAVREGLTNVARHARATRCTVTLAASAVEIRDDGVGGAATARDRAVGAAGGNGLTGLRERAAAVGARVDAGPLSPRGWRLRVSLDAGVS